MQSFTRKNIRLNNFEYKSGYVYFVTICTFLKKNHFRDTSLVNTVESNIDFRINNSEIDLYCYCIMPNHIHLLLRLNKGYTGKLTDWISAFKRFISKEAKQNFGIQSLWQRNYYDHVLRDEESIVKVGEYILNNPVRKNMVKEWQDYPFSKLYAK